MIDIYFPASNTIEYIIAVVLAGLTIALIVLIVKLRKESVHERHIDTSLPPARPTFNVSPPSSTQIVASAHAVYTTDDEPAPTRKVKLSRLAAVRLTCNIRQSLCDTLGNESYTNIASRLTSAAIMTLHRDYPMLTSRQLCHAVYIALGLTPEQTSRAMNIEFGSLKKCRTRLRKRLNLPAGASLEDTFSRYISE